MFSSKEKKQQKKRSLQMESLEQREMLSVAPLLYSTYGEQTDYSANFTTEASIPAPTYNPGTDVTATSVKLTWDASTMTGLRFEDPFKIERSTTDSNGTETWTQIGADIPYSYTIGSGIYSYELKNLTASTAYKLRVSFGSTVLGCGYTEAANVTTLASEVKAEALSSTSIKLSWNIAGKTGTYFNVQQRLAGSGASWTEIGKVKADGSATATKTFTTPTTLNLTAATQYEYRVEYNDTTGALQQSQTTTCETLYVLQTSSETVNSVNLSWSGTLGGTSHEIQICPGSSSPATATNWSTATTELINSTEFKVTGLKENNSYYFRLRYNVTVDGEVVTRYTDALNYSSPTSIKLENVSDTSLKVLWTFTGKSGSAYYVQVFDTGLNLWKDYPGANTTNKNFTLTGLNSGTSYDVRVRYTSTANVESYSASSTLSTGVATTLDAFTENSATISWNIPDQKPATTVNVERCDGSLDPTVDTNWRTIAANVSATSYTNNHLGSDNKYYFRVTYTATNNEEKHTLYTTALTNGTLTASETSLDSIKLDWNFTPKQGSNTVVEFAQGDNAPTSDSGWGTTTITYDADRQGGTVTGLIPGRKYFFRIKYTSNLDTVDSGTPKQTSTVTSAITVGSNLIATEITDTTVALRWAVSGFSPASNGTNFVINKREVNSGVTGSGNWTAIYETTSPTQNTYTASNLMADTTYEFRIDYKTGTGGSTTLSVDTKPAAVSVNNVTKTGAKLNWTFNTDKDLATGNTSESGSGLGAFVVQKYNGSNKPTEVDRTKTVTDSDWTTLGSTTDNSTKYYNLTDLTKSSTQYYRIVYTYRTGVPVPGAGTTWDVPLATKFSELVEVTTASDIKETYTGTNAINVSWDSVTLNSGTKYSLRYRVAGTGTWLESTQTTATAHSVTDLTADTEYEFKVVFNGGTETAVLKVKTNLYILSVVSKELAIGTGTATAELAYLTGESGFILNYRLKGDTPWLTSAPASTTGGKATFQLTLIPETEYEFKIVYNCNSLSHETEIKIISITDDLMPSGVTGNSVTIKWDDSSFPDKRSSSSYVVQWHEAGSVNGWTSGASTNSNSFTASTGLEANKEYEFRVQYTTDGGATAYSTIKKVHTKQPVITTSTPQFGKVKIAWTFISTGGYEIQYKGDDNLWHPAVTESNNNARDTTFANLGGASTPLNPDTEYLFRVAYKTAQSGAGFVYSDEIKITTRSGFKVEDNSITAQGIKVKWDYVTDSVYTLQYQIAGTGIWIETIGDIPEGTKEYTLTGLSAGVTYLIHLTYHDSTEKSADITVTTSKMTPPKPGAVTATDIKCDGAMIKWTDNSEDDADETYIIEVTNNVTGVVNKLTVGNSIGTGQMTKTLTGLDTKTAYTVKVYVKNTEGSSEIVQAAFTTLDIPRPAAVTNQKSANTTKEIALSWKIKSVTDIPDPTTFRIEYYYEDKVAGTKLWYEVTGLAPAVYDSTTQLWTSKMIGTFNYGEGTTVTLTSNTSYKFRIIALAPPPSGTVTYGNSTPVEITVKTTALVAPTSPSVKEIKLTSATINFKDNDKNVSPSTKTYTIYYAPKKYTDWSKVPPGDIQSVVLTSSDIKSSTAASTEFAKTLSGLNAETVYSYIIESGYLGETVTTKPSSFTTSKMPTASTLKGGYTLEGTTYSFLISWKPPKMDVIPTGVTVDYVLEVSTTGKTGTFVTLPASSITSTSTLKYTTAGFSDVGVLLAANNYDMSKVSSLSFRVACVFTQGTVLGTSYSSTGRVTLPKFA